MVGRRKKTYDPLEKKLGYRFRKTALLEQALLHRSFRFENKDVSTDNQRLEFLGDAVLGFVAAAELYSRFQEDQEGVLTSYRSQITNGKALAEIARSIDLGEHIKMGKGEELSGGRKRQSNLADAFEAILGAAYLDGNIKAVHKIFSKLFLPLLDTLGGDVWADNTKGKLQEYCQRKWKSSPNYRTVKKEGPPHDATFTVQVRIPSGITAKGKGTNKQEGEMAAAHKALQLLDQDSSQ
jgi:ribonuclease-3